MKRILLVITTVTLLLSLASSGEAWQVNVKNSCTQRVRIQVKGDHLFTRPVDCQVFLDANTTGTCQLPGAICPVEIIGEYWGKNSQHELNQIFCAGGVACCWNVNVEVVRRDPWTPGSDSCKLELR
jgi:hypothetical protein